MTVIDAEKIIKIIEEDNHANGLYANLAQFTNGYDTASNRIINLIRFHARESTTTDKATGEK